MGTNNLSRLLTFVPPVRRFDVLAVLALPQDLTLLLPVIETLKSSAKKVHVLASWDLAKKYPTYLKLIEARNISWSCEVDPKIQKHWGIENKGLDFFPLPRILLTGVEASWAHELSHVAAKYFNQKNIPTATFQHGLDHPGLTYSETGKDARDAGIASRFVFTWSDADSLNAQLEPELKGRIHSLGYFKYPDFITREWDQSPRKKRVAVFENLHWERYSNNYRARFIETVLQLAKCFPEYHFDLKQHPAGQWTELNRKNIDFPENLKICMDNDPYSSARLICQSEMVFSTPSSILLDAVALGRLAYVFPDPSPTKSNASLFPKLTSIEDFKRIVEHSNHQSDTESFSFIRKKYNIDSALSETCEFLKSLM